jgi:hypothetical protein
MISKLRGMTMALLALSMNNVARQLHSEGFAIMRSGERPELLKSRALQQWHSDPFNPDGTTNKPLRKGWKNRVSEANFTNMSTNRCIRQLTCTRCSGTSQCPGSASVAITAARALHLLHVAQGYSFYGTPEPFTTWVSDG